MTDSDGKTVSVDDICGAISDFVNRQTFDLMIVFFSGHGILKGPEYELWLLSGAPDNTNEAVNVPGSISLARNCQIPHVVIISDACRSIANTSRLNQIGGSEIFPNKIPQSPRPEVDVFYATLPGDPALEVSADKAIDNYKGIFNSSDRNIGE